MVVDLSPVAEVEIDEAYLEFVNQAYCANCAHFTRDDDASAYCSRWEEPTEIRAGYVCAEYRPQGFPDE